MAVQRPAWQVALATVVAVIGIGGGVWKALDVLMVSEAEAAAPKTGYITKERAKEEHAMEAINRAESDARLAETLDRVVQTVERIDKNQILIGERLRVRRLDKGK